MKVRVKYTAHTEAEIEIPDDFKDDPESFISATQMPMKAMEQAEWLVDQVEVIDG